MIRRVVNAVLSWRGTPVLIVVGVLLFLLGPIWWTVLTAFKPIEVTFQWPPVIFPRLSQLTLDNFAEVFTRSNVPIYLRNSVYYSFTVTAFVVVVGSISAYGLSMFPYRGSSAASLAYFATRIVPPQVLWVPFVVLFLRIGMGNSPLSVVVYLAILIYPIQTLILKNVFDAFPRDLLSAGQIDGCSRLGILVRIVVPVTAQGIAAVAIMSFLGSWSVFMFPFLNLNNPDFFPITVGMYEFVGDDSIAWGALSAASVVGMLPTIVLFVVMQRYIVSGLAAGAFK